MHANSRGLVFICMQRLSVQSASQRTCLELQHRASRLRLRLRLRRSKPWGALLVYLLSTVLMIAVSAEGLPSSCTEGGLDAVDSMCPTTSTVLNSEVGGHSLVQSMSVSRRIGAGAVVEESRLPRVANHPKQLLSTLQTRVNSSSPLLAGTDDKSGQNSSGSATLVDLHSAAATPDDKTPVIKEAGMQILMQLVKKGSMLARSAANYSPQAAVTITGSTILIVVVVFITCLTIYILLYFPEMSKLWQASEGNRTRPAMAQPTRLPSRTTLDNRSYVDPRIMMSQPRPLSSSPPLPARPSSALNAPHGDGGISSSEDDDEQETEARFCPDLVVPQHCECILLVPFYTTSSRVAAFDISDMNGSTVLRATTQNPGGSEHSLGTGLWRVFLTSAAGDNLAQCREVRPSISSGSSSGATEFHFLRTGGQYFAKLMSSGQDRYELHTLAGKRLHFWGNFNERAVNVTDDSGRLLATTELHSGSDYGQRFKLRVAPMTDVGLTLCGLLCINKLLES